LRPANLLPVPSDPYMVAETVSSGATWPAASTIDSADSHAIAVVSDRQGRPDVTQPDALAF